MNDDKVVSLRGDADLPPNLIVSKDPYRSTYCRNSHGSIELDEHRRTVTCRDCGQVLDAFEFLKYSSRTLQMAWRNHESAKAKVSDLVSRIEVLQKELASLQGKVRRAKEKAPAGQVLDVRGKDRL